MFLMTELNRLYSALKGCDALSGCSVIKAYPYVKKPTILKKTVVTVSPAHTELKNVTLGEKSAFGVYGFNIDVFVPQQEGSPCESDTVEAVIKAVFDMKPIGIKVSDFRRADVLNAFTVRCVVQFSGAVDLSGEVQDG